MEPAYRIASAMISQRPKAATIKIYSRTRTAPTQITDLTPTKTTAGFVYQITINDTSFSYTVPPAATVATICTALAALYVVAGVTVVNATTKITLTPTTAGTRYFLSGISREFTLANTSADDGITADLNAAITLDPSGWFGFVIDAWSKTEIAAASVWAEANARMFVAQTADTEVVVTGSADAASVAQAALRSFTTVAFTRDMRGNFGAALMARQFSRDPGSDTWALKVLAGPVGDALTASELSFARGKNALTYTATKGTNITLDGKAASGRYLDITRGIEWLKARLQEDLFILLINLEKLPYTDAGISQVQSVIMRRLLVAESVGLLTAGSSAVFVPTAASALTADKIARVLKGVTFSAQLAGAIHSLTLNGTVTV